MHTTATILGPSTHTTIIILEPSIRAAITVVVFFIYTTITTLRPYILANTTYYPWVFYTHNYCHHEILLYVYNHYHSRTFYSTRTITTILYRHLNLQLYLIPQPHPHSFITLNLFCRSIQFLRKILYYYSCNILARLPST